MSNLVKYAENQIVLLRKITMSCEFCGEQPEYHFMSRKDHFYFCNKCKRKANKKIKELKQ